MKRDVTCSSETEDHFFFASAVPDRALYGRMHWPTGERGGVGVVIVPPIGRERVRVSQEMAELGRSLAASGFPTLRFDYGGEGESAGEFCDSTVRSRVADTVAAVEELRSRRSGQHTVALVGLHLGSLISVAAATRADVGLLVMCDPVWDVRQYVSNLLRANVFQQSQYFGSATLLETDLRAMLREGKLVEFYGFLAGAALVDELEALDISEALKEFSGKSTILCFSQKEGPAPAEAHRMGAILGNQTRCAVRTLVMNFSWATRKRWTPQLTVLNDAVVAWLRANSSGDLNLVR